MKNRILILIILALIGAGACFAFDSSNGGINLRSDVYHGGSAVGLQGTGISMQNLIGQPVIGVSTGTGITGYWGGLYGMAVGALSAIQGAPPGTVPLTISRSGNNIKLTWDSSVSAPEIYVKTGTGSGGYDNNAFTPAAGLTVSGNTATDAGQVNAGDAEKYYKGVMAGYASYNLGSQYSNMTCLQAAWAVGKINVTMQKGWNSVSSPFSSSSFGGDSGVAGDNYGEGDTAYFWSENAQDMSTVYRFSTANKWGSASNILDLGRGCMFNLSSLASGSTRTATLIGDVAKADVPRTISIKWNDIGTPIPVSLASGGFNSTNVSLFANLVVGDTISEWGGADFSNTIRYSGGGTWVGTMNFKPGAGYWFNHVSTGSSFTWTNKKLY